MNEAKRWVRLILGDGPDCEVVGTAEIIVQSNGDYLVNLVLQDEEVADAIGIDGLVFTGIISSPKKEE